MQAANREWVHAFVSNAISKMGILNHTGHVNPSMAKHCRLSMMSNCCTSVNPPVFPLISRLVWAHSRLWLETFRFLRMGPHNCGWKCEGRMEVPCRVFHQRVRPAGAESQLRSSRVLISKAPTMGLFLQTPAQDLTADDVRVCHRHGSVCCSIANNSQHEAHLHKFGYVLLWKKIFGSFFGIVLLGPETFSMKYWSENIWKQKAYEKQRLALVHSDLSKSICKLFTFYVTKTNLKVLN